MFTGFAGVLKTVAKAWYNMEVCFIYESLIEI